MNNLLEFWKNDLVSRMFIYRDKANLTKGNIELKQNYIGRAEMIQELLAKKGFKYELHF